MQKSIRTAEPSLKSAKGQRSAKPSAGTTPASLDDRGPIAIVGISGRYPKAENLDELWANLIDGVDAISEAKGDRWDLGYHGTDGNTAKRIYTKAGGFLDRIDLFDAEFFGMSPREAKQVDPQHRLLLELSWEAMESAGIVPASLAGTQTGVFVGISNNDYAGLVDQPVDAYTNIGSALSIAANRISYVFDFHGPSMSIDTACSSSMVAMHQACSAIRSGDCSVALVGGVNILASMKPFIGFAQASMLSPDGRCKSFDAEGNGYVRAEGGGVVILKPLIDAERDGDAILGVILATGVNSDGRTMGMALPNGEAQESLLRDVYGQANVKAEDVFYVEAHGTGTAVGDPIECGAIGRVLGAPRTDGSVCLIGSVKSNIGHLEPAAGIAGLTKLLLSIRHGRIPANLHFRTPNPKIDFDGWKLRVADSAIPLPASAEGLVFGINSFGFGGTNAHMVLRQYHAAEREPVVPAAANDAASDDWADLLVLTAHSPEALDTLARSHVAGLSAATPSQWAGIKATAALARTRHPHRLVLSAGTAAEAADMVSRVVAGEAVANLARSKANGAGRLALVYSGNGPQWAGMGRELMAQSQVFRDELTAIDAIFSAKSGWSLIAEMQRPQDEVKIELTEIAQPLLFAQQLALTGVLRAAGIVPDVVFGHSVGEAAAACVSGALTREQATEVILCRSQTQALTAGSGRMAALGIGALEAAPYLAATPGWLEIAAINSPQAITVAGELGALESLRDRLTDAGKFVRILPLNYPFHTKGMDPIQQPLLARLAGLVPTASSIPFISTVEGRQVEGTALDAQYWWHNVRSPVRFDEAVAHALTDHDVDVFLEVGPHPVLKDYLTQTIKATEGRAAVALTTLRRPSANRAAPERETIKTAICAVYAAGAGKPDLVFKRPKTLAKLPTYPFTRTRFWRGASELPEVSYPLRREHPLLGYRVPSGDGLWSNAIQRSLLGYLGDHVVQGAPLFPAAGYIELAFAAGAARLGDGALDLETFEILKPLVLAEGSEPIVQVSLDGGDGTILIRARADSDAPDWTDHVKGRISKVEAAASPTRIDLADLLRAMPDSVTGTDHYDDCNRRGLVYGPWFQGVTTVHLTPSDARRRAAIGEIVLPALAGKLQEYRSHPAILDSCLQVLITLIGQNDPRDCATIPVRVGRIRSLAPLTETVFCHVVLLHENARVGVADLTITDSDGNVLLTLEEARFQKVEFRSSILPILAEDWRPDPRWTPHTPQPLALPEARAVAETVHPALSAITADMGRAEYYAQVRPRINMLIGAYAIQALKSVAADELILNLAVLARNAGVIEDQRPTLARLVSMAEEDGALARAKVPGSPVWTWNFTASDVDPEILRRDLMLDHPGYGAELVAIAHAAQLLLPRLRGEAEGQSLVAMREALEDTAPFRLTYNRIAAETVRGLVAAWPSGRPIRVLELGGGTGGLTASILPVLPPERSDYLFLDPSDQAAVRAGNRFASHHFVRTATGEVQTLSETGFDIIVSAAPLSVSDIVQKLTPGGAIIVVEPQSDRMTDMLFGLGMSSAAEQLQACGLMVDATLSDALVAGGGQPQQRVLLALQPVRAADGPNVSSAAPPAAQRVILVSDAELAGPFVVALTGALQAMGQSVSTRRLDAAHITDEAMAELVASEPDADEFIHLAGWAQAGATAETALAAQDMRTLSAVLLARAIDGRAPTEAGYAKTPSLTLVTRGAFAGPGGTGPIDPFQAPLAGIGRVIANEQATLGCRLIDVHAAPTDTGAAKTLAAALVSRDKETETLLLDGQRFVNRLRLSSVAEQTRIAQTTDRPHRAAQPFQLDFLPQRGLDSLHLREIERRSPRGGEIEIEVHAAGLNFRDVLWTMGMLPEDAVEKGFSGPTIGMECAGKILRVGPGVSGLSVGDKVVAFAASCFASHVTTTADCAALMPTSLGYAAAATIPTAFVTAWYALDYLARLEPGETVLIHGAAGGVGLAALQIAKLRGAIVFASAGSQDKQRLVRTMGADHVLSSRSLKFADDILALTGGKGVDVVLNSLAGEAITKGLQVLKPFGRFLEIGKRDLYANSRIGLRPFRQNLSYFGIDADTLLVERPVLAKRMFDAVMAAMAAGQLRPLPYQATPISRAGEAFRAMQQARHVGKLVVSLDAEPHHGLPVVAAGAQVVRPGVTYLVTGGLGGFGLATAEWLAAKGATSLALLSRSGATTHEAQLGLTRLRAAGVDARAFAVDIADRSALDTALAQVRATMAPLKGVVHAAAVIEDAPLVKVDRALFHKVMAPKMLGALNLHEATLADQLELFVLYSSSSAVVGNPGQGAYVAANMFLDSLAQHRHAQGLPALSVGWGAIKDAGFLTRNAAVGELLVQRAGMEATPVREALAELGRLLASGACRVAAAQFNLMQLGQSLSGARTPRFAKLVPEGMNLVPEGAGSIAAALEAMGEEERRALILTCVAEHVGRVVGYSAAQITADRSLTELGLDSLMAVELADALESEIGRPVSVMQMIQAGTVAGVVDVVMRGFATKPADQRAEATATPAKIAA